MCKDCERIITLEEWRMFNERCEECNLEFQDFRDE